jgi:hypothetical protein
MQTQHSLEYLLMRRVLLGKLLDFDYARTARQRGFLVEMSSADEMVQFPLESARLRSAFYLVAASTLSVIGYGWTIDYRVVS